MSEREQVLIDITNALPALQEIDNLCANAINIDQQNMAMQVKGASSKTKTSRTIAAFSALGTWIALDIIYRTIFRGNPAVYIIFAIVACIVVYNLVKRKVETRKSNADSIVERNNALIMEISDTIYNIAINNQVIIGKLPRDYRYYSAADFFERVLVNGQADTMKEAINLYEESLHRQKLETSSAQNLEYQRRQCDMLANIESNTYATAQGVNTAAIFSVLTYLKLK